MAEALDALNALRDARMRLFEACQRREKLIKGARPISLRLVDEVNAEVSELREAVQAARAAAEAALSGGQ